MGGHLCQYVCDTIGSSVTIKDCVNYCPYYNHFGRTCCGIDTIYNMWDKATSLHERKMYAMEFLEELKQIPLKEDKKVTTKKLVAILKNIESEECKFYGAMECYNEATQTIEFNGKSVPVCDDCRERISEIMEAFGIKTEGC